MIRISQTVSTGPQLTKHVSNDVLSPAPVWWTNGIFFVTAHLVAFYGVIYASPISATSKKSLILAAILWQSSLSGITIGYHRLYSHRAFRAPLGVRVVLAVLGSMAFQGSIKWWCLRHRLHHRFTDDPVHDPYAATRGLFFSHMGWIFFKPSYAKLELIDKSDLEKDPVVRYQHNHYVPIALFFGLIAPALLGWSWGDARGGFIWGGLIARIITWHCTFLVNSLAHWDGFQNYSDEVSARGNLILALCTCGEGNHNFHAFPHDFRSGPDPVDWDPSKWIIQGLSRLSLASHLRRARDQDIKYAMEHMRRKHKTPHHGTSHLIESEVMGSEQWKGPFWNRHETQEYVQDRPGKCFLVLEGYLLHVTGYLREHPGGAALLRTYSLRARGDFIWQEADWAFKNLNTHSLVARRRMGELRIAKITST